MVFGEIEGTGRSFLQEFARAVAEELVDAYLNLKRCVSVLLIDGQVLGADEWDLF